jgi:hypothetical protein
MCDVSNDARGIARAVACIVLGLTFSPAIVASDPQSESSTTHLSAPASPEARPWGGIGGAGGGFRVTPTRVVFEGRTRSAELTLVNTGVETATYRVSLGRMRMSEDGAIEEIVEPLPGENFADSLVRFSPRQVELEPGVAQTVRMQLRMPASLPAGEYRSHLVFRALPPVEAEDGAGAPARGTRGVSIALRPVFGAAIPVIVRRGETAASVTIGGLELRRRPDEQGGLDLALEMRRTGNRSVYGDVTVFFTPLGGRARNVGGMRGLAVYLPNAVRRVVVPLRIGPNEPWKSGTFRVTYEEAVADRELLAEAELALP